MKAKNACFALGLFLGMVLGRSWAQSANIEVWGGLTAKDLPFCLKNMHAANPDNGPFTLTLQDEIASNRITVEKNPDLPFYCIDKHRVAHARLLDCSDMTNGFCNGHLYINHTDFGERKEQSCGCKWREPYKDVKVGYAQEHR